jgi:pimeloyl-ACP methyl ester carboxylesterase
VHRVLLIHGIQSGPSTWWRVGADLETLGFEVDRATLPAHAGRPAVATLAALADAVAPEAPSFVVGHSLGALVALELAARRPDLVLGLLLEDPPSRSAVDPVALAAEVRADADEAQRDPDGLRDRLLAANPLWAAQDAEHAVANRAAVDVEAAAEPLELADWDVAAMAAAVPGPITVLAASPSGSALGEPERSALLATATSALVVESGHGIHRDRPGVWVAAVAAAAGGTLPSPFGRPGP